MKNLGAAAVAASLAFSAGGWNADAAEIVKTENVGVNLDGRLQVLGHLERVESEFRDQNRAFMFLRQARVGASGYVEGLQYRVLLGFAGEDEAKAPSPGVSLGLLDMYVDVPLGGAGNLRVGQFKTPYGLERMTDSGSILFADRSIANGALRIGRDMGAAYHARFGNFVGAVGLFTGGGRDVPERYLPQVLGVPLVMARVGIDNGLYENAFAEPTAAPAPGMRYSVGLSGAYTKDTQIGHSTVMNVRLGERSLLMNPNWNPLLGQTPTERGQVWQAALDGAVRVPVGPGVVTGEAELQYGEYGNAYGNIEIASGRAQVGYNQGIVDAALRYAVVRPDADMAVAGVSIAGGQPYHEVTPGVSIQLFNPGTRLVLDLPVLLQAPVITEPGIGAYVLSSQPDQTSYLKNGGTVDRMNVVQARAMFQAAF
jgi:Phosphate-selective porin O and P